MREVSICSEKRGEGVGVRATDKDGRVVGEKVRDG